MSVIVNVPGHGEVEFPDGMSDEQMSAAIRKNFMLPPVEKEKPQMAPKSMAQKAKDFVVGDNPIRDVALGARNVASGVLTLPLMIGDAINYVANMPSRGWNALGANIPLVPSASQSFESVMTRMGAPEAQTPREKLVAQASRGGASGAAFPAKNVAQLLLQGLSGSVSGGTAQAAENAGVNPLLATGLGVVAGMAVPSSPDVFMAAGRGGKAAVQPFTKGGREEVVGNALARMATQPKQALMNMGAATDDVSRLTTAQAARDPGLLSTERALANLPASGGRFPLRYAEQNAARRALLDSTAGTADDISRAVTSRGQEAEKLYSTAFATGPLKPTESLISLSKRPAFEQAAKKAMEIAGNEGLDLGNPLNTMRGLHYLKMGVDDLINDAKPGSNQYRALNKMKDDLLASMDDLSPAYKTARERYAEVSQPINRMNVLQEIRQKTLNSGLDVAGNRILSQDKFTKNVTDKMPELQKVLSPRQIDNLQRIARDLDYGVQSQTGGKVAGSNTFQNISVANVLGSVLGREAAESPVAQSLLRPLGFLYKLPERQVEELMIEAMLDRNLAMKLMSKATERNVDELARGLKSRLAASTQGSTVGAAASQR